MKTLSDKDKMENHSYKRYLAIGLIVLIVFLSLPNFCGAHEHSDDSPSFKYSKQANEHFEDNLVHQSHDNGHGHAHEHGKGCGHSHEPHHHEEEKHHHEHHHEHQPEIGKSEFSFFKSINPNLFLISRSLINMASCYWFNFIN